MQLALNTALRDLTMFGGWAVNIELTHSDAQEDDNGVVKGLVRLVSVRSCDPIDPLLRRFGRSGARGLLNCVHRPVPHQPKRRNL